jgi:hypothetical protein
MQTFSYPVKTKEVQATGQKSVSQETMANAWSIYDVKFAFTVVVCSNRRKTACIGGKV